MDEDFSLNSMAPGVTPEEIRQGILALQELMMEGETLEIESHEHYCNKVLIKEVRIPAGTLCIGKIHRFENFNIISSGDVSVLTDEGVKRYQAPASIHSPAGVKRVVFAHTDTVWSTIHPNPDDERDIAVLEDTLIMPNYQGSIELTHEQMAQLTGDS